MDPTSILAVIEKDLRLIFRLQECSADYGLRLSVARSFEEATLYLRGIGVYGDRRQYPDTGMILLDTDSANAADLKMLSWIRENQRFCHLPVGLLAVEPPHKLRVACAVDPLCFVIDRETLWELPSLAWQIFFPDEPSVQSVGLQPSLVRQG